MQSHSLFLRGYFSVTSEAAVADKFPQEGGEASMGRGAVQPAAAAHPRPPGRPQATPHSASDSQASDY
jgi:hypothetical protein